MIPYTSSATDVWDALKEIDADPSNPDNVLGIYSRRSMPDSCRRQRRLEPRAQLAEEREWSGLRRPRLLRPPPFIPGRLVRELCAANKDFGDCISDGTPTCGRPRTLKRRTRGG